jgi:ABC-type nitrate/sulfonate/bicarbonate transport system permease component
VIARGEGVLGSTYLHIGATMFRLAAAFLISLVVGTTLGVIAGRVPLVFDFVDNLIWVFMAVPSVVWVFIFAVALGISQTVPIAAVSALLTPMVLVHVAEGAKSVPTDIDTMARSYKAGRWQRLRDIYIPFLVPYIISSARVAFALGIKLIVIAEVVGLSTGIGYEVKYWFDTLRMGPIVAWGLVMIAIGLVIDYTVFGPLERRASAWKGLRLTEVG